jgi:hypothetical protein
MRITEIREIASLSPEQQEAIRVSFDELPIGFFEAPGNRPDLVIYVLGTRRIVAPRDPSLEVGTQVSGRFSPFAISQMSNQPPDTQHFPIEFAPRLRPS